MDFFFTPLNLRGMRGTRAAAAERCLSHLSLLRILRHRTAPRGSRVSLERFRCILPFCACARAMTLAITPLHRLLFDRARHYLLCRCVAPLWSRMYRNGSFCWLRAATATTTPALCLTIHYKHNNNGFGYNATSPWRRAFYMLLDNKRRTYS